MPRRIGGQMGARSDQRRGRGAGLTGAETLLVLHPGVPEAGARIGSDGHGDIAIDPRCGCRQADRRRTRRHLVGGNQLDPGHGDGPNLRWVGGLRALEEHPQFSNGIPVVDVARRVSPFSRPDRHPRRRRYRFGADGHVRAAVVPHADNSRRQTKPIFEEIGMRCHRPGNRADKARRELIGRERRGTEQSWRRRFRRPPRRCRRTSRRAAGA